MEAGQTNLETVLVRFSVREERVGHLLLERQTQFRRWD